MTDHPRAPGRARFISCSRIETKYPVAPGGESLVGHDSFRARGLKLSCVHSHRCTAPVGHDSFRARGLKQSSLLVCRARRLVGHDSFRARGLKLELARRMPTSQGVGHDSFRARGLKPIDRINAGDGVICRARFISCSRIETTTAIKTQQRTCRARFISCSRIETKTDGQYADELLVVGHDSFRARGLKPHPDPRPKHSPGRARFISCSRIETPRRITPFSSRQASGTIHFVLED